MSRPRWSRVARWAGLLALVFTGLAGVAWWQVHGEAAQAPPLALPLRAASAVDQPVGAVWPVVADASTLGPTLLPVPAPEAAPPAPLKPGEYLLCGLGRRMGSFKQDEPAGVPVVADDQPAVVPGAVVPLDRQPEWDAPAEVSPPVIARHLQALMRRMASSGDVRQQGAALVLGFRGDGGRSAIAQLVQLALTSGDVSVMLWAQRACLQQRPDAACAGLTVRHWLRLEPDNLVPWLALLDQEPANLDEALHGMALATRADQGFLRLLAPVDQALSEDLPGYLLVAMLDQAISVDVAQVFVHFQRLLQACSVPAMAFANRQQACLAIGKTLAERGNDAMLRMMGVAILKRLDNDTQRGRALRATLDTGGQRLTALTMSDQPYSCDMVARRRAHARRISSQGEWAVLEALGNEPPSSKR